MNTIQPPENILSLNQVLPTTPILLMGAGPVPLPATVAAANSQLIHHLGPTMDQVIDNVKAMARYAFQTESQYILGLAAPSSGAMEMAITNLLWPGQKVLVLKVGTFSGRFAEMATAIGADVTLLEKFPITLEDVADKLEQDHFDVLACVHGESSCGYLTTDLAEICQLAKRKNILTIVDAVCTLTTMPFEMDNWQIDVTIVGAQKGLSSIPGTSMIAFSEDAWHTIRHRPSPPPHWCYNALLAKKFWQDHQYHYTAPVPGILALHEALDLICEETLEKRFARHLQCSQQLQAGLLRLGLELHVPEAYRLNSVVAFKTPQGSDSGAIRASMLEHHNIEISGAFGMDILRIGQMGEQCRSHNIERTLDALEDSINRNIIS